MDILQLMHSKSFYGKEFLTWLWFNSEVSTGRFTDNIELWVDDTISLESVDGDKPEKVILKGVKSKMSEAKLALRNGKQVVEAKFILIMGDEEWIFVMNSFDFSYRALKTPKTEKPSSSDEEDGYFLDKINLIEKVVYAMDDLFEVFMRKRLEPELWEEERKKIWSWILGETEPCKSSATASDASV